MRSRPHVYLDENVSYSLGEALRERGFPVSTTMREGLLGAKDEPQLMHAASRDWVILSHNRRHFRRWHQVFAERGHTHAGIALLPQQGTAEVRRLRATMLLEWIATFPERRSRLFNWGALQELIERGYRVPGFSEQDVNLALGRSPG